jgi:hypothetical protein
MRARRAAVLAFLTATLGGHSQGRAGLRDSSERLAQVWREAGAAVVVDKTRFLNEDETAAVAVPSLPSAECTTVVFLGARGLGFDVRVLEAGDEEAGRKLPSEAGAVSIERCGGPPPGGILLHTDSGRGAVETIVARSHGPLSPMRVILPERTGGAQVPGAEPGPAPSLPPPAIRADVVEGRARRDGAVIASRVTWQSAKDGSGTGHATLGPGCHRMRILPIDAGKASPRGPSNVDLDAEMRNEADDRLLARDRSDAPDADLTACVGEPTRVEVLFAGSPPDSPVLVSQFAWPLPNHLPTLWGSDARARMARVLLARNVGSPPRGPFVLAQGGSGGTPVPVSIEPGACYFAVLALIQGSARAVALRVHVGTADTFDDRGIDDGGAAVAFCASEHDRALAHVEVRGASPLSWGLAVYRLEDGIWTRSR